MGHCAFNSSIAFSQPPNVAGVRTVSTASGANTWMLRLDAVGNVQWQKAYLPGFQQLALGIVAAADGGYAAAGEF